MMNIWKAKKIKRSVRVIQMLLMGIQLADLPGL